MKQVDLQVIYELDMKMLKSVIYAQSIYELNINHLKMIIL